MKQLNCFKNIGTHGDNILPSFRIRNLVSRSIENHILRHSEMDFGQPVDIFQFIQEEVDLAHSKGSKYRARTNRLPTGGRLLDWGGRSRRW
jgi:hypothetical protein